MQTFAPEGTFEACARVLDKPRLNKQITEVKQILKARTGRSRAYVNHPATRMWWDNVAALRAYGRAMLAEWRERGGKGHLDTEFDSDLPWRAPWWWGGTSIMLTHQSRLNHKWLVDELRKAIPRGHWPLFRQLYCQDLPKNWNEFSSRDRIDLTNILMDLGMPPDKPHYQYPVADNLHYIWPTEPGKYKIKRGKTFVEWRPGDPLSVH